MPAPITQRLNVRKRTQEIDMFNGHLSYIFFPRHRPFCMETRQLLTLLRKYERSAANHRPHSFGWETIPAAIHFRGSNHNSDDVTVACWRILTFRKLSGHAMCRARQHAVSGEAHKIKPSAGCV
jgi:hypothetical protein